MRHLRLVFLLSLTATILVPALRSEAAGPNVGPQRRPPALRSEHWQPTRWHGEEAYVCETRWWRAVVSIDRGRLVHFGPPGDPVGYLHAPASRDDPEGWGGHRVWLGPQSAWPAVWPPEPAWEASAAESFRVEGRQLFLVMPASGYGWPRITRIYEPLGDLLACRVRIDASGTRDAQIVQIVQTRPARDLSVPLGRTLRAPEGFVLLPPIDGRTEVQRPDPLPPHASFVGERVRLVQHERPEKFGFRPRPLVAWYPEDRFLELGRGALYGLAIADPDEGYFSQVYLAAAHTPIVELEQLSPLMRAGLAA
jgi:hypothetical protein